MKWTTLGAKPAWTILALSLILLTASGCGRSTVDTEWPQFRGPDGLGVADGVALPTTWGEDTPNVRWRAGIPGRGNSSPVVADGKIFLTSATANPASSEAEPMADRTVLAVDLASGEVLWQTVVETAPPNKSHLHNTNAAPTPVTDGEWVYVYFGTVLAALDLDGNVVWRQEVDPDYPSFVRYGTASSLVLVDGALIVVQDKEWAETEDIGWMGAFDAETGEELWRNRWTETCCAYSTPLIWQRGEDTEMVFAHSGVVVGYDPSTGEQLWEYTYPMLQFVASLVVSGEDLLCALGGAHNNRGNLCLRLTGRGKETQLEELWYNRHLAPESASAVLYQGNLYAVTERGAMVSYDPISGDIRWRGRLGKGRGYRSSLVAGDGKVYAVATDGFTAVVDANATDSLEALAYNQLGEGGNNATPAVAGGCLIIRSHNELFCIESEGAAGEQVAQRLE